MVPLDEYQHIWHDLNEPIICAWHQDAMAKQEEEKQTRQFISYDFNSFTMLLECKWEWEVLKKWI